MKKIILLSVFFLWALNLKAEVLERPPQFVLISFDGSYADQFWKESFHLADQTTARFSYFVSGVYFIQHKDHNAYQGPGHRLGSSDIGFGDDNLPDIQTRTENVWQALQRNFDIGSHANGHFDGGKWTEAEWFSEFTQFHRLVEKVFSFYPSINESFSQNWESELHQKLKGFRAPLLAENAATERVLKKFNYLYDSSKVLLHQWPYQMSDGIWNLGLSQIDLSGSGRHTIAMDYNILYGQCAGHFNPQKGGECAQLNDSLLAQFEEQTYQSYIAAFLKSYYANRAPLSIGHHFSLFNRGIYWHALQRFVYAVCTQPEVKCITHSDMIGWLENQRKLQGEQYLADLNSGRFSSEQIPMSVLQSLGKPPQQVAQAHIMTQRSIPPEVTDLIEQQMLKGDFVEAHLYEKDDMDLMAVRYSP